MMKRALLSLGCLAILMMPAYGQDIPDPELVIETQTPTTATIINPTDVIGWNICNETSYILRLANATLRDSEVKAQGWREVNPGQCIVESVVRGAPRFLYAESSYIHRGGIREWKGEVTLCAQDSDFVSVATDDCRVNNFQTRNYFAVKPDEQTTTLIEPSDFGEKAQTAGIQRLLRDSGYQVTGIDGLPGRRTSRSLREFQKAKEFENLPEGNALIAVLAQAAKDIADEIGLEICNKSDTRIFTAIGLQEDGNWTSRGWWAIDPNNCVRPVTHSIQGLNAHYYALKEAVAPDITDTRIVGQTGDKKIEDLRLRSVATIPAQFCIAESQFSALGRELCLEGGYGVANFRPLPTDKDGVSVSLANTDFAAPSAAGLRR